MTATDKDVTPATDPQFAEWFNEKVTKFFGEIIEAKEREHISTKNLLEAEGAAINNLAVAINHALMEARYMGTADFAHWCVTNDQSSFRQERAWFKLKPSLLIAYQAALMENLARVRTNVGLDPEATVRQIKYKGSEQQ